MERLEIRERKIIYCDLCNKELTGNYTSVYYDGKERMDFCSTYHSATDKRCLDYHNEEMLKIYEKNEKSKP